jgi:hypothetical protein
MKLAEEKKNLQSNFGDENSQSMGIGDESVVIDILRNRLYENKIQTLVQEYMSNARDAHREIGQTDKQIEVQFPTRNSPTFAVRDYGPGITPERMSNVFVLYGASTKRASNKQTGGFGIGAKSGWSYTDSFNIDTYVDGIHRVYIAHISASNKGSVDLVQECETTEPNGTRISLMAKPYDVRGFAYAIIRGTMFWTPEEYPTFTQTEGYQETLPESRGLGIERFMGTNMSGVDCTNYTGTGNVTIINDGIPYPMAAGVEIDELRRLQTGVSYLNVFIPNGLVQVSASREKIDDSDFSKRALRQIFIAALADFNKAKLEWEEAIIDPASMLAAANNASGFRLSTKKHVELVKLISGKLHLQCHREPDDEKDERLFTTNKLKSVGYPNAREEFSLVGPNKYYLLKSGAIKINEIKAWLDEEDLDDIDMITVLAQKETDRTVNTGTAEAPNLVTITEFKRNQTLVDELVPIIEKLGFIDIETVMPKIEKVKKVREKGIKIKGTGYRITGNNSGKKQEVRMELHVLDAIVPAKPWIYFIGRKYDSGYDKFREIWANLRDLGEVEMAFRILETNKKNAQEDPRMIEYTEFIKTWVPSKKIILGTIVNGQNSSRYDNSNYKSSQVLNIMYNMVDKKHILYLACEALQSTHSVSIGYYVRDNVLNSQTYKDGIAAMIVLNNFIDSHLPFLEHRTHDSKHTEEYITWRVEKAMQAGCKLDELAILIN